MLSQYVTLAHQLTYPEILTSTKAVCDLRGYMVGGPDRKGANALPPAKLWKTWQEDVVAAGRRLDAVPQHVMDYFQATKHLTSPPKEGTIIEIKPGSQLAPEVLAPIRAKELQPEDVIVGAGYVPEPQWVPMGVSMAVPPLVVGIPAPAANKLLKKPRFSWSLTSLQDFENCPHCYAEKRYFKRVQDKPFDAQDWGNRLHKTAEDYAKHLQRCAESNNPAKTNLFEPELLAIVKPYCDAIAAAAKGGELHIEHELALTRDLKPCSSTDWNNCWYRGKSDVSLKKGTTMYVYDFKSGKKKDDPTQLELMCACEAILDPTIENFEGRYIWLKDKSVSPAVTLTRADLKGVWSSILGRVKRMMDAWDAEIFPQRTSGLCKAYCPVLSCPNNGRR